MKACHNEFTDKSDTFVKRRNLQLSYAVPPKGWKEK